MIHFGEEDVDTMLWIVAAVLIKALKRHPEDFELNYRAGKYNLYGKRYPA